MLRVFVCFLVFVILVGLIDCQRVILNLFETVVALQSSFDVSCAQMPILHHRNVNLCWRLSRCLDQVNM